MNPNEAVGMGQFILTFLSGVLALGLAAEVLRAAIWCSIGYLFAKKLLNK